MSSILLFIAIWLIIFDILATYKGLSDISEAINDLYILYFEETSNDDDDFDLDFIER